MLAMYDAAMRITADHMEADGGNVEGLIGAVVGDKCAFAFFEAMTDGENVDPCEFQRVVEREVVAGRLRDDDLAIAGEAAAMVLRMRQRELQCRRGSSAVH